MIGRSTRAISVFFISLSILSLAGYVCMFFMQSPIKPQVANSSLIFALVLSACISVVSLWV